jgi:hypothetical protein
MTISQELFNTLMTALHVVHFDNNTNIPGTVTAMQSLADMYPEQRKVWWTNNSWKFNGFPE